MGVLLHVVYNQRVLRRDGGAVPRSLTNTAGTMASSPSTTCRLLMVAWLATWEDSPRSLSSSQAGARVGVIGERKEYEALQRVCGGGRQE